ncbi:MAG: ribosome recycling factor [Phycisphaeraceae bacterium]|nr:ribosome recycling factor [Phycisphaerae bacterium]MBX3392790.1 ribosome recycling factor [Phycisphaeraceae bacterium]HRJ50621.1 ribosome recycling factor [Phycisphaerales bacterium]
MTTDPDTILLETQEAMEKAVDYLKKEFRGLRTGRASPALIEFVKVEYYGSMTDLKSIASISVPEPAQLLIKPFDAGAIGAIRQAIESSGLNLNPISEGKQIRLVLPALTSERRAQLVGHCKKLAEEARVTLRNARRDANKHAEGLAKQAGTHYPEDEIETLKEEIQALLKQNEDGIDKMVEEKSKEITTV